MASEDYIDISRVAQMVEEKKAEDRRYFSFQKNNYKLLVEVDAARLIADTKKACEFRLCKKSESNGEFLWLQFNPDVMKQHEVRSKFYYACVRRIVENFFIVERDNFFEENDLDADNGESESRAAEQATSADSNGSMDLDDSSNDSDARAAREITVNELYRQLRDAHAESEVAQNETITVQHENLKPKLTDYQKSGVKWMFKRETVNEYFDTEFKVVLRRWPSNELPDTFFYNDRTAELKVNENNDVLIPSGGILADEMGLGKTVEMLALILLNKRKLEFADDDSEPVAKRMKTLHEEQQAVDKVKCFCSRKVKTHPIDLIECTKCHQFQHRKCVLKHASSSALESKYICPACWQHEPPIKSKATFIVSPNSIKMQWYTEVEKHINDDHLKILVYDGLCNLGWISPADLAEYDIVLTDYNILNKELHYSNAAAVYRHLRAPARYLKPISPLPWVNWWRVCVDEAQMVEGIYSNSTQMIGRLSAVHRWGVTGTPIEKSINDLYGLVHFLNCSPYNERDKWNILANEFIEFANPKPLVEFLQRIMWRTCKSKEILEQINTPPQKEIVHYLSMTDLELFFYNTQHENCRMKFLQKTRDMEDKMKLSTMNPHILKLIMEPLKKLRIDCSMPSTLEGDKQTRTRKVLKPDDLQKHLTNTNEIQAKSELRTIGSSLNGLAGLYIIKGDTKRATNKYRSLLKWAKDYTGKVCVDSLLQVHAIFNLLLIDESITEDERDTLRQELNRLEAKYLQSNASLISNFRNEQNKWATKISTLEKNFSSDVYQWWADILFIEETKSDIDQLMNKIKIEIMQQYTYDNLGFGHVNGLSMVLATWIDKIASTRNEVQNAFQDLEFFMNNLRPIASLEEDLKQKMEHLICTAFECHLDLENQQKEKDKRKKASLCQLCLAKIQLETYECVIFDKRFVSHETEDTQVTQGTWKPAYQELILRTILSHARHLADGSMKEDGKVHMQLLEALRNEFKEYSQLWVEVNYTVSAYDEINMCKSRMRAFNPVEYKDEEEEPTKTKLDISIYEIDDTLVELQNQLNQAEIKFVRKLGTLKYLEHLQENKIVEDCPICSAQPQDKYIVLDCGHHMCTMCFVGWKNAQHNKQTIRCFICRHEQQIKTLNFVTPQKLCKLTNSSSKIEEILQTVTALLNKDATVKIVIFSHWTDILRAIEDALVENKVSFRSRLNNFHLTIKEFKDPHLNVTCLLLPLQYGSKGLNLIEATHVFLVEPILNPGEELQAIGRIHRIGQTKQTYVHRFIVRNTIEETIFKTISNDKTDKWSSRKCTVQNLVSLFEINNELGQDQ